MRVLPIAPDFEQIHKLGCISGVYHKIDIHIRSGIPNPCTRFRPDLAPRVTATRNSCLDIFPEGE